MFVSSTTMLCLYVFTFCWVNVRKIMEAYDCNHWRALLKSPFSGILILYTFVCAWFVGGLTAFHLYLICTNQVGIFSLSSCSLLFKMWFLIIIVSLLFFFSRQHMRISGIGMMGRRILITLVFYAIL